MKSFVTALALVALSTGALAAESKDCRIGKIGTRSYQVIDERMDDYGNFKSRLKISGLDDLTGKGRYYAEQEEAYLQTKYINRETGLKAVITTDFQQDGALFTLCIGKDLKDTKKTQCTSCVDHR